MPSLIVGIDAAWTARHPSGVALVRVPTRDKPRLLRIARSYEEFCSIPPNERIDWKTTVRGSPPDIPALLATCEKITGEMPQVIALDIPLGARPITGRRTADNMVTRLYSNRRAGTHSPNAQRPGLISRMIFQQLTTCGFTWLHAETSMFSHKFSRREKRNHHVFIEAYPHPAIIELLNLTERLKYKVSKRQKYWPAGDRRTRWAAVAQQLDRLRAGLAERIHGIEKWMPSAQSFVKTERASRLKGYEDAIDAVVCAWIGCEFLAGRCVAYGDAESAIWLPRPTADKPQPFARSPQH
jgi:predicted RNase H-like nuclease